MKSAIHLRIAMQAQLIALVAFGVVMTISAAQTLSPAKARRAAAIDFRTDLALVVGCGAAGDETSTPAVSATNDARAVADILRKRIRTFAITQVGPEAARAGVEAAITRAETSKSRSPRLLLYLSGACGVADGRLIFFPHDAKPEDAGTGLVVDALISRLAAASFTNLLVIVDASAMPEAPAGIDRLDFALPHAASAAVIVAWPGGKPRDTREPVLHSPFTRALLDTWSDPALAAKDGWTWLPAVLSAVSLANDPKAAPPRVQMFSKMTDSKEAMWLDLPRVPTAAKAASTPAASQPASQAATSRSSDSPETQERER